LEHAASKPLVAGVGAKQGIRESQLQEAIFVLSQGLVMLDALGLTVAAAHVSLGIETAANNGNSVQKKPSSID